MQILLKDILAMILKPNDDWRMKLIGQWSEIVGSLQARMRLEKIEQDGIVVGVYDSHWMYELFHMSNFIKHIINQNLGGIYVKNIRFILVVRASKKKKYVAIPASKSATRIRPPTIHEYQALANIHDEELKQSLVELLQRVIV